MLRLEVRLPRYRLKHLFANFGCGFTAFTVQFFRALKFISPRLEVYWSKYGLKVLFADFKFGFTAFAVLFYEY